MEWIDFSHERIQSSWRDLNQQRSCASDSKSPPINTRPRQGLSNSLFERPWPQTPLLGKWNYLFSNILDRRKLFKRCSDVQRWWTYNPRVVEIQSRMTTARLRSLVKQWTAHPSDLSPSRIAHLTLFGHNPPSRGPNPRSIMMKIEGYRMTQQSAEG